MAIALSETAERSTIATARASHTELQERFGIPHDDRYDVRWEPQWQYPDGYLNRTPHLVLSSAGDAAEDLCLVQLRYLALASPEDLPPQILCSIRLLQGVEGSRAHLFKERSGIFPFDLAVQHLLRTVAAEVRSGLIRLGLHMDQVKRHKPLRDHYFERKLNALYGYDPDRFTWGYESVLDLAPSKTRVREILDVPPALSPSPRKRCQ